MLYCFLAFSFTNNKGPTQIALTIAITEALQHKLHPTE